MLDTDEIINHIHRLRKIGQDTQTCEVKEAVGKLPSSIPETMSAFANGEGGLFLLGLSEKKHFAPADGFHAASMQDAMVSAGEKLTPVVRPDMEIIPFEGHNILAAWIYPKAIEDRPCYVTAQGMYRGSYIRTGDGDRRLSRYEIDRMLEANRQPCWDSEIVMEATTDDLDPYMLRDLIARQKILHPRIFEAMPDEEIMKSLRIVEEVDGVLHPTLAGLLALGIYPQKYFPSLTVSFSRYQDTANSAGTPASDERFVDSRTIVGSIPVMIAEALDCVRRNMHIGAVIDGAFRKELPDYPLIAVREAIANALQHRDYSPAGRASSVSLTMYADCLEVLNPGGLYGRVAIEDLGKPGIVATRNQFLSNILETTPFPGEGFVVENRGSGIRTINLSLEQADMYPAEMHSTLNNFRIVFSKRRRTKSEKERVPGKELEQALIDEISRSGPLSVTEIVERSGLSKSTVSTRVKRLVATGILEPMEVRHSPKQRYRLVR